ncbi:MAG: hypothetical protein JNK54_00455 [Elusimicrobia bacterium]|nr:hypothetical protein [Elusimicrobiota bacterium]
MIGLGGLWLLIVGVILLTPLLALLAFIRVGTVQKRLNILEREFEKLRHRDPLPPPPKPLEIPIPPPREPLPPSDPFTGISLNIPPEKPRDPEKKVAIEPTTPPLPARPWFKPPPLPEKYRPWIGTDLRELNFLAGLVGLLFLWALPFSSNTVSTTVG